MALDTFNPYLFVSAGEQSNKFLTPVYADGIAKFQAQRAQGISGLTVQFGPIQEGTGDPSPENIRTISGRTGLTAYVSGKNLIPNIKYQANANSVYLGANTANNELYLPIGTYTLSVEYLNNTHSGAYYRLASDSANRPIWASTTTAVTGPFTVDKDEPLNLWLNKSDGISANNIGNFQVEAGSTATEYTQYTGHTYPISWQTEAGTVYGGTLDIVNGVLTVDWDYIASYNGETLPGEWISDRDVYAEGTTPTTGAEVAYKLAEPVTYQLDPEQIMTVPGFNQVYADAGPVIDIQF